MCARTCAGVYTLDALLREDMASYEEAGLFGLKKTMMLLRWDQTTG